MNEEELKKAFIETTNNSVKLIEKILELVEENNRLKQAIKDDNENATEIIAEQSQEIKKLKEICDKYEEEHNTKFKEWLDDIDQLREKNKIINNSKRLVEQIKGSARWERHLFELDVLSDMLEGRYEEWRQKR